MFTGENSFENLLKVEEASKALRLSKPMIYKLIQSGKLSSIRFGTAIRLTREDLVSFVQTQRRVGGGKP